MTRSEFEKFLNDNEKDIYKFCFHLAGNKEDADELYQDVWIAIIPKLKSIDAENNPKSYVYGQAVIKWRDRYKKIKRRNSIAAVVEAEEIEAFGISETLENLVISREIKEFVCKEIYKLKEPIRIVVELYYSMELSTKEISSILHIPKGTVESRLFKARKILKKRLEEYGYENV